MESIGDKACCAQCGQRLAADGPLAGLCPRCVWPGGSFGNSWLSGPSEATELRMKSPAQAMPLLPGETLGPYRVEAPIGSGGLSDVYRVVAPDGAVRALKLARSVGRRPTWQLELQQNELDVLKRLTHPALVRGHDGGLTPDGRVFIVMDLVEGVGLSELLRARGRFELLEALWIAIQVAEALAHCHEMGVLHLDLKAQNIMVVDRAALRVRVLDFGLSRAVASWESEPLVHACTPGYAAPECLSAERARPLDGRADLYSLGVLLFELVTGVLPFRGQDTEAMLSAQREGARRPLAPGLAAQLEPLSGLLDSLLEPTPESRYPSAAVLARELTRLFCGLLGGTEPRAPHTALTLRPHSVPEVPLVGRGAELAALFGLVGGALAGQPACALVHGQAGVGKSRLVTELLARVGGDVVRAYARCPPSAGFVRYAPLRLLLARLARELELVPAAAREAIQTRLRPSPGAAALLVTLSPELRQLLTVDATDLLQAPAPAPRALEGQEVADGLADVLDAISAHVPLVLVLEDVQWADPETRDVLERFRPRAGRYVVLATQRRGDGRLARDLPCVRVGVLDAAGNLALVGALLGGDLERAGQLVLRVPALRSGVPAVTREVVRDLEVRGAFARVEPSLPRLAEWLRHYRAPATAMALLGGTMAELAEDVRHVLGVLASLGPSVDLDAIDALHPLEPEALARSVALASRAALCSVERRTFRFIDERLRVEAEAYLAQRLGLEADRVRREPAPPRAPDDSALDAARASLAAARRAEAREPQRALPDLTRVFELLAHEPRGAECDALLLDAVRELSHVASALGDTDAVLAQLAALRQRFADGAAASLDVVEAALRCARGELVQARRKGRSARNGGALIGRPDIVVEAGYVLGCALFASGRIAASVSTLARSHALVAQLDPKGAGYVGGLLGAALGYAGRFDEAERHVTLAQECAQATGHRVQMLDANLCESLLAEAKADHARGLRAATPLIRDAERYGLRGSYPFLGHLLAGRHAYWAGLHERSWFLLHRALDLARGATARLAVGRVHAQLGDLLLATGQCDDAVEAYATGRDRARDGGRDVIAFAHCTLGLAHALALRGGAAPGVKAMARRALHLLDASGYRVGLALGHERYAELCDAVGEHGLAARSRARHAALTARLDRTLSWRPRPPLPSEAAPRAS